MFIKKRKITKASIDELAKRYPQNIISDEDARNIIGRTGGYTCGRSSGCYSYEQYIAQAGSGMWMGGCVDMGNEHIYVLPQPPGGSDSGVKDDDIGYGGDVGVATVIGVPEGVPLSLRTKYYNWFMAGMSINPSGSWGWGDFIATDAGGGSGSIDGGSGGGGNGDYLEWSQKGHNTIINNALRLTETQMAAVRNGSKLADEYQDVQYNFIHALRQKGESVNDAIAKMRTYFVAKTTEFIKTGNYSTFGEAIHPVMDAYHPAHAGFQEYNGTSDMLKHTSELFNKDFPADRKNAEAAVGLIMNRIEGLFKENRNVNQSDVDKIFNEWLFDYSQTYL